MRFTSRWLTWLCLSLMLWAAIAESTHTHPNKSESASCSICVVAHSTAPSATTVKPGRYSPRLACCKKKKSSRKPGSVFLNWAFVVLLRFRDPFKPA